MALSQTKARPMLRSSTVPVTGPSPQQDGPSDGDHATRPIGECKVPAELVSRRRGLALLPASAGGRCLKMQAAAQNADAVRILVMLAAIAIGVLAVAAQVGHRPRGCRHDRRDWLWRDRSLAERAARSQITEAMPVGLA